MKGAWLAVALPLAFAAAAFGTSEPPTREVNCDALTSVADITAAILVSADPTALPDCRDADEYRDHAITDGDLRYLEGNIFFAYETPWTPTPTGTPTTTPTPTPTRPPTITRTASATPSQTPTAPPTDTATATLSPTALDTATVTQTPTVTVTPTVTITRTPTGLAQRLAGEWFANWQNRICFLDGVPSGALQDTTYVVTAVNGRLDIDIKGGAQIARGAEIRQDGSVAFRFTSPGPVCGFSGRPRQFVFDYVFTFGLNGFGAAEADWNFGVNSFCAVCFVSDSATLAKF